MKQFYLDRKEDESGVSGTGKVAVGVCFPSGHCVIEWLIRPHTMGLYETIDDVIAVHGHNGKTEIIFEDD